MNNHRRHNEVAQPTGLLCALCVLCGSFGQSASAIEYLPGIAWPEPVVVTPGKTDAQAPSDAIVLFDGNDLSAWNDDGSWTVADGAMIVGDRDIRTKRSFGDCQVHLEWSMPNPPKGKGQHRGNSGIYFMPHYERERDLYWKYEIQILDSYQNKTYFDGQAAAIYKQQPPMANAMRPPGEWNTYDIVFTAPRFNEDGSLQSPASVTLVHNGVLVHNHVAMAGPTSYIAPPAYTKHADRLPIGLQNHGHKVRYRNIWVREIPPIVGTREHAPMLRDGEVKWRVGEERLEGDSESSKVENSFFYRLGKDFAENLGRPRKRTTQRKEVGVVERVPRFQRWKIDFHVDSADELARFLDHHRIVVGVFGKDNKVHLASGLSQESPIVKSRESVELATYGYMVPQQPEILTFAERLAKKAGIRDRGPIVLLFFPFEVEAVLWTLERKANKKGDVNLIRETTFDAVVESGKYAFRVKSISHFDD